MGRCLTEPIKVRSNFVIPSLSRDLTGGFLQQRAVAADEIRHHPVRCSPGPVGQP